MKINYLRISIVALLVLSFSSCSTIRVNYYSTAPKKVNNIALVSTMIDKIQQSPLPLIDAAVFNKKTNDIADQIMDLQKKSIDKFRDLIGDNLRNNFKCEVIYGDSLHKLNGYNELSEKFNFKNALRLKNDNFPLIITATDDINPFNLDNGNISIYFHNSLNYKSTIKEIAKQLNVDYIAVSVSRLASGAGYFGITGMLQLITNLYLFDSEGNLVVEASNFSKATNVSGKNIDDYNDQLHNISIIIDPMMKVVISKFKNSASK